MKKAVTITIAGTLFTIEEDAYLKLDIYLKSIHAYFGTSEESTEIIKDIEARIAERLLESKTLQGVITIDAVEKLMVVMGSVEDFGDRPDSPDIEQLSRDEKPIASRRFFRNADDVVISGVASGVANFFGIDVLIVRIIFIALTIITSGGFIFFYILLAIFIPQARTPAEKMQQRGGPITLTSFKENLQKNTSYIVSTYSKPRQFIEQIFKIGGQIIRSLVKVLVKLIGVICIAAGLFGIVGATFIIINVMVNSNSPYIDFPLATVISTPTLVSFLVLGFLLIVIPCILIAAVGKTIIRKRKSISSRYVSALCGMWIVVAIWSGAMMVRYVPEIADRVESLPQYQHATVVKDARDFTAIDINGPYNVHLEQGPLFSVQQTGRQAMIDHTSFMVENGTLTVTYSPSKKICVLCAFQDGQSDITITMPTVQAITAGSSARIESNPFTAEKLVLTLEDVARADLTTNTQELIVAQKDVSRATLIGTTTSLGISAKNIARFDGLHFQARTSSISTHDNSRVSVNVADTLYIEGADVSTIIYRGSPKITKNLSDLAKVSTSTVENF